MTLAVGPAALPARAQAEGLTEAWLLAQAEPEGDAEWQCLKEAIYFEARGESLQGQIAVAEEVVHGAALAPGKVGPDRQDTGEIRDYYN